MYIATEDYQKVSHESWMVPPEYFQSALNLNTKNTKRRKIILYILQRNYNLLKIIKD